MNEILAATLAAIVGGVAVVSIAIFMAKTTGNPNAPVTPCARVATFADCLD